MATYAKFIRRVWRLLAVRPPLAIYGATALGCQPGVVYGFQGRRYVRDGQRDALVPVRLP